MSEIEDQLLNGSNATRFLAGLQARMFLPSYTSRVGASARRRQEMLGEQRSVREAAARATTSIAAGILSPGSRSQTPSARSMPARTPPRHSPVTAMTSPWSVAPAVQSFTRPLKGVVRAVSPLPSDPLCNAQDMPAVAGIDSHNRGPNASPASSAKTSQLLDSSTLSAVSNDRSLGPSTPAAASSKPLSRRISLPSGFKAAVPAGTRPDDSSGNVKGAILRGASQHDVCSQSEVSFGSHIEEASQQEPKAAAKPPLKKSGRLCNESRVVRRSLSVPQHEPHKPSASVCESAVDPEVLFEDAKEDDTVASWSAITSSSIASQPTRSAHEALGIGDKDKRSLSPPRARSPIISSFRAGRFSPASPAAVGAAVGAAVSGMFAAVQSTMGSSVAAAGGANSSKDSGSSPAVSPQKESFPRHR